MIHAILPILAQFTGHSPRELLLAVGGVMILLAIFSMMRKRRQRATGGTRMTGQEQLERMKQERAVRGDIEQLMVELEQLTRRFSAQLDAKTVHIEKLLREADQRIALLEAQRKQEPPADSQADPAGEIAKPTAARATVPASGYAKPTVEAGGDDVLKRSVYELADQGMAPEQIARRLKEHIGKVELMLALRQA